MPLLSPAQIPIPSTTRTLSVGGEMFYMLRGKCLPPLIPSHSVFYREVKRCRWDWRTQDDESGLLTICNVTRAQVGIWHCTASNVVAPSGSDNVQLVQCECCSCASDSVRYDCKTFQVSSTCKCKSKRCLEIRNELK